ncbi:intradiol ring-cleavage dioxygenase [Actinopolyspora sp. H202]|uniref:intradiol ring-cleavage dioxygenase n=1 Tax=Actinopolyspora sp. H202 TaxID=1500456 RepID=UPI003EE57AD9
MTERHSDDGHEADQRNSGTTRRTALAAFGGLGIGTFTAGTARTRANAAGSAEDIMSGGRFHPACVLAPEQMEGPYYLDYRILRRNITEHKRGIDLLLNIIVVDAARCEPLPEIAVDIWHCDALGVYSSYTEYDDGEIPPLDETGHAEPTDRTTWLRGVQLTDRRGFANFRSIVPGWYRGRTTHIHIKTITGGHREDGSWRGGDTSHTGQLYFPREFNERLARTEPYSHNTIPRTTNAEDLLYNSGDEGPMTRLDIGRVPAGFLRPTISASIVLGIHPEATPPPEGLPPGAQPPA